jgi:hypothetical protein
MKVHATTDIRFSNKICGGRAKYDWIWHARDCNDLGDFDEDSFDMWLPNTKIHGKVIVIISVWIYIFDMDVPAYDKSRDDKTSIRREPIGTDSDDFLETSGRFKTSGGFRGL